MKIKKLRFLDGAKKAEGLTVIIDVFRAYTTAAYLFSRNAEKIFIVSKIEKAFKLKQELNKAILIGERKGIKLTGFDYNNSPYLISQENFSDKKIILTTSAGTKGIIAADNAAEIICGSFVTISAAAKYIKEKNPAILSLVAMGNNGVSKAAEDDLYSSELIKRLRGEKMLSEEELKKKLRFNAGQRFFDENTQNEMPEEDFYLCLEADNFNYAIKAEKYRKGVFELKKLEFNQKGGI